MGFKDFKTGIVVALLAGFLAGCAGTGTEEDVETDAERDARVERDEVATGRVDDRDLESQDLGAGGVDTVFYFEFDRAVLKPEAREALKIHAKRLQENPRDVRIEGHTDERGTREYNMALGERRANAVKEYLVLQGVDPDILEVVSYGEERPVAMGSNERSWAQNRRAELK